MCCAMHKVLAYGSGEALTANRGINHDADGDQEADGVHIDVGERVDDRHAALQHGQGHQQVRDHREDEEHLRGDGVVE